MIVMPSKPWRGLSETFQGVFSQLRPDYQEIIKDQAKLSNEGDLCLECVNCSFFLKELEKGTDPFVVLGTYLGKVVGWGAHEEFWGAPVVYVSPAFRNFGLDTQLRQFMEKWYQINKKVFEERENYRKRFRPGGDLFDWNKLYENLKEAFPPQSPIEDQAK